MLPLPSRLFSVPALCRACSTLLCNVADILHSFDICIVCCSVLGSEVFVKHVSANSQYLVLQMHCCYLWLSTVIKASYKTCCPWRCLARIFELKELFIRPCRVILHTLRIWPTFPSDCIMLKKRRRTRSDVGLCIGYLAFDFPIAQLEATRCIPGAPRSRAWLAK